MTAKRAIYLATAAVFFSIIVLFYIMAPADTNASLFSDTSRRLTLLDSEFWNAGSQSEPDFDGLHGEINPLTQTAYTSDQVERIRKLWRLFPENSLLPRPQHDRFRREKEEERISDAAADMTAGLAAESEIEFFYSRRMREIQDRMQLVEFVLTEQWPPETMERYRAMLGQDKILIERTRAERQVSLEIARAKSASPEPK